jgi:hypothetical protein
MMTADGAESHVLLEIKWHVLTVRMLACEPACAEGGAVRAAPAPTVPVRSGCAAPELLHHIY